MYKRITASLLRTIPTRERYNASQLKLTWCEIVELMESQVPVIEFDEDDYRASSFSQCSLLVHPQTLNRLNYPQDQEWAPPNDHLTQFVPVYVPFFVCPMFDMFGGPSFPTIIHLEYKTRAMRLHTLKMVRGGIDESSLKQYDQRPTMLWELSPFHRKGVAPFCVATATQVWKY